MERIYSKSRITTSAEDQKMNAIIYITGKLTLNMDSPTFPAEMSPEERLKWWLEAAREEPEIAFVGADWIITGMIDNE